MKRLLPLTLLLLAASAYGQAATNLVLTATSSGGKAIPTLTWSNPGASSCTATGDATWVTAYAAANKPVSGTVTLAAASAPNVHSYTLSCVSPGDLIATVSWTAPTQNTDGSPLTDLGGFRLLWGKSATVLDQTVYVQDQAAKTWVNPTLTAGTWYFGVMAFNTGGIEGALSNVASKTLTAGATDSKTVSLAFPGTTILTVK